MPYINSFNTNEDRLREILRVKANQIDYLHIKDEKPKGLKTIEPNEKLSLDEWFNHIKTTIRERDKFGNLIIK